MQRIEGSKVDGKKTKGPHYKQSVPKTSSDKQTGSSGGNTENNATERGMRPVSTSS